MRWLGLDAEQPHQIGQTVNTIQNITREDLNAVVKMVPPEWMENDGKCLSLHLDRLVARGRHLDELMSQILTHQNVLSAVQAINSDVLSPPA